MKTLSEILDEIEQRAKDAQEKEYDSVWKFRKAVGMSADDVPVLVKVLRRAMMWIPDQSKDQANVDFAAILNGEKTDFGETETK